MRPFWGQGVDLEETRFWSDFCGEPKPVILQPAFGRGNFDNLDFARAVFMFQILRVETNVAAMGI